MLTEELLSCSKSMSLHVVDATLRPSHTLTIRYAFHCKIYTNIVVGTRINRNGHVFQTEKDFRLFKSMHIQKFQISLL